MDQKLWILIGFATILGAWGLEDIKCQEGVNFLPHPENCSMYFSCVNDFPHEMSCPPGFFFNPDEICDPNYDCSVETCPESGIKKLPVEGDCESYILCIDGKRHELKCQGNLIFDKKTSQCVLPKNSDCVDNVHCSEEADVLEFIVDPRNCTFYYICDSKNVPHRMECPEGTIFKNEPEPGCIEGDECS
ncbi:peritrophin-1-like [Toxorhynchites rutilus septentrionalis]|uniref:peritrophin-1-like n=1 Tax=Toxorhynchites rutilus septentrionalis TaxID=329112 RepID=UPI0024784928|nr:peritrophin-1-like [Toxorhynchites rutilus septentrionalis]